jgi:hypothetical protein
VSVPRYIRVCSLIETDVTVANLDEGKSSDLGTFGRPPSSPAPITSRWAHHQPSSRVGRCLLTPCNQGSCVCRCHRRGCAAASFSFIALSSSKRHIKLQLVLIAYTTQNWSSRLLFPSAWNNFTAIRSMVVMLNSNTYRSSFRAAQAGYIQMDRGPKRHAVSRQVTSRRISLLKDSRQLVVQEPFRVRSLENRKALPSNTRWASPCIAARPLRSPPHLRTDSFRAETVRDTRRFRSLAAESIQNGSS